jgi:hypothetical protein
MAETGFDPVLMEIIKAAVNSLAIGTFELFRKKISGSHPNVEIADETRASLQTYYEHMALNLRPVRLFHFNDTRWIDQIYVSLKTKPANRSFTSVGN